MFVVYKPPSLWYSVMTAQMDKDSVPTLLPFIFQLLLVSTPNSKSNWRLLRSNADSFLSTEHGVGVGGWGSGDCG